MKVDKQLENDIKKLFMDLKILFTFTNSRLQKDHLLVRMIKASGFHALFT